MLPDLLKKQNPADWETTKVCFCRAPISYPFNPFTWGGLFLQLPFSSTDASEFFLNPSQSLYKPSFSFRLIFSRKSTPSYLCQPYKNHQNELLKPFSNTNYLYAKNYHPFSCACSLNKLYLRNYSVHWAINIQERLLNFFLKHSWVIMDTLQITRTLSFV